MTRVKTKKAPAKERENEMAISGQGQYPLVPLLAIQIVERPELGHENDKLFYNPRTLESFTPEEMAGLMDSIREDGLQQPPIVRVFTEDGSKDGAVVRVELIAGERRLRSIQRLYDDQTPCKNEDGETLNAKDLYEKIPCKVYYNLADEKALRIAFAENHEHQKLSIKEEIALVERLTARGLLQEEICTILGTNPTWVSQTANFRCELPEAAFQKLAEGKLSRHVAVQILSYRREDRQVAYDAGVQVEEEQRQDALNKIQSEVEQAEDDEDLAEHAENQAVQNRQPGDVKKAARRKQNAEKRRQQAEEKKDKVEEEAGTIRQGHLTAGAQRQGLVPKKAKILTKTMIEQFYCDLLGRWLGQDDGKIDPVCKKVFPKHVLETMRRTALAILAGEHDPAKVARRIMVELGEWEYPEGFEETPTELLDVPEGDQEIDD